MAKLQKVPYKVQEKIPPQKNHRIVRIIAALIAAAIIIFAWSPWITDEKAIKAVEERLAVGYPYTEPPNNKICEFCRETNDAVYRNSDACKICFPPKVKWNLYANQALFGKEVVADISIDDKKLSEKKYFINTIGKISDTDSTVR